MQKSISLSAGLLLGGHAFARATQTGDVLRVIGGLDDSIQAFVAPDSLGTNQVVLFGVPNTVDGVTFTGVLQIDVLTLTGQDSVEMDIESAGIRVNIDNSTRSIAVKIALRTPPDLTDAFADFTFNTGTRSDSVEMEVENRADDLALGVDFNLNTAGVRISDLSLSQSGGDSRRRP